MPKTSRSTTEGYRLLNPQINDEVPAELDRAFDETFDRLCRWFRARGVGREESADLAQDAFARALVHLRRHGLDSTYASAEALLNTISRNLLIDRVRSAGPMVVPIEAAAELEEGSDPIDEIERAAARRAVADAIGSLSDRHRRAMLLTLDGLGPAEIAEYFGIQRNAADALLHRARRRMAEQLRSTVGAMLGLWVLVGLKLRTGARRVAIAVRHVDGAPTGLLANVSTAVVAIGLMAMAPVMPDSIDREHRGAAPAAVAVSAPAQPDGPVVRARVRAPEVVDEVTSTAKVGARETVRDPVTGEDHEAGLLFWHEADEDGDRGVTGEIIADAIDTTCRNAPALCEEPA